MKTIASSKRQKLIVRTDPVGEQPMSGDVRQRLMVAALELLQSQGIHALTQARVAEAAGLRQSHLTYYFRTRNDLLKAIVEEGCSALLGMIGGDIHPGKVSLAKFRNVLASAMIDKNMPRLLIALTVASDEDPALKVWLEEFDRGMLARLATTFQRFGLKPSIIDLTLLNAAIVGTSILGLQYNDPEWTRTAGKVVRLAFDRLVANSRILPSAVRKPGRG